MPCGKTGERTAQMDRKAKKPLMEKRRRARINKCLGDLKNLLLEHLKRDPSQTSKLEKADILEMTVHLLRRMQQDQLTRATLVQPSVRDRFLDGWRDCATQVSHYANTVDGVPNCLKDGIQRFLADRYRTLQQTLPVLSIPHGPNVPEPRPPRPTVPVPLFPPNGFLGPHAFRPFPPNFFPALPPSAPGAPGWHGMVGQATPNMPPPQGALLVQSGLEEGNESVIKGDIQKGPLDTGSRSASRELTATPACFERGPDDEDSASCSSSEATDQSASPVSVVSKDNVWRPW